MKKLFVFLFILMGVGIGVWWRFAEEPGTWLSPLAPFQEAKPKPLAKYSFEKLQERGGRKSKITLETLLKDEDEFVAHLFSFTSEERKITGLVNTPKRSDSLPVVVMLRGWVDSEVYQTGMGTSRAGEYLAQNGFITLAPDFLGYGQSDDPPDNVWEERLLKPIAILDLLASLASLPQADIDRIALWGHSNGGMVALSVLEISGKAYPTTLWAPVSKPFPYDVLYYTDEFDDKGKLLRAKLAEFEKDYDVNQYSFDEYLDWLQAPLQIHQGAADDAVPLEWSNEFVEELGALDKEVAYYTYPGADHNMKGAWDRAVARDVKFFKKGWQ